LTRYALTKKKKDSAAGQLPDCTVQTQWNWRAARCCLPRVQGAGGLPVHQVYPEPRVILFFFSFLVACCEEGAGGFPIKHGHLEPCDFFRFFWSASLCSVVCGFLFSHIWISHMDESRRGCTFITISTENLTSPTSTKSRNPDSSVSRGTNWDWNFGLICICTEQAGFLDKLDFRGVAFSVKSVITSSNITRVILHKKYQRWRCHVTYERVMSLTRLTESYRGCRF